MTRSLPLFSIILAISLAAATQTAQAFPKGGFTNLSAARHAGETPLPLSGTVAETMNAGGYTYIALENKGAKSWVAVPQMEVTVGKKMSFSPGVEIANFSSKTLNRTFERIVFSQGPTEQQAPAPKAAPKEAPAKTAAGKNGTAKVEKAAGPNAYTVAELYKNKNTLNKRKVAVRGKVVKVAMGIMGKNWVHLRDGSGSAKKKTNDLTVTTTAAAPNEGDVVTAVGVLRKDRDFGAGYKYELIIEDGTLEP
ncbi:DNA-binding protein [Geobacter sp. FeAm09]|uniref:OB-fold nucleic acid binding domain-containing protein n=1 Tax=Geobacter sp. FeAm09 TaxID=2597769 RepID=UPI0011EC9735|nr:OB-fold nucleic acid binding domain-containing protein [Geobacter sp. FeAm09]QEM67614.1 DNA-binding protein [Geobacter sp. FeAm09]